MTPDLFPFFLTLGLLYLSLAARNLERFADCLDAENAAKAEAAQKRWLAK